PPPGYGEVSFYWWLGDPLTKERLAWQLDQLQNKRISALQVNYAHSDKGGRFWGYTYESEPRLFSEPWWNLFSWFLRESKQRGMAVSLSDYTLGWAGNGWYTDDMLRAQPGLQGSALARESHDCTGECVWQPPSSPLTLTAWRLDGGRLAPGSAVDLGPRLQAGVLRWNAPPGVWRLFAVYAKPAPSSIDPMHPLSGKEMIDKFFQPFENRNPGESGKGLNFFFSDELNFGVKGWLWNSGFAAEFRKRKGYDVVPELLSLFEETGPRAPKVRLDYSDVMVALSEEHYFRPLYEWHTSRGMMYGCDHGGRGRDVTEFGDYFRTQRWMTAPGNDQPRLAVDIIKNKVASSIAHLYERPRTWLEGYYSSGWGTTSAQLVEATWRNFAQGHNLLTLHGLYYSTHGGWWEWAPPCNHFRMPYWAHMGEFLRASERMSYLLSQGHHRADVAIVYPVAAVEAGRGGKESVATAFALGQHLYSQGIDFDFIDFESLARARVEDRKLKVAGEEYRVLLLPAMRAVRHSTLEKAVEFRRAGGLAVIVGAAPEASERNGDRDPDVLRLSRSLASSAVRGKEEAAALVNRSFPRDFVCEGDSQPSILHRRAGPRDNYLVYGAEKGRVCSFRATGAVELWDPWTGVSQPLPALRQDGGVTSLRLPLEATEAQVIVFAPGKPLLLDAAPTETSIPIEGPWEFELVPTLDNRFGDFRLPAAPERLGAEARRFRYAESESVPAQATVTSGFGPRFYKLGPLPADADTAAFEQSVGSANAIDPRQPVRIGGREYRWSPYEYSLRFGIEGDPGHQGYHGLKAEISRDFIGLGKLELRSTTTTYAPEPEGTRYYLWTTVAAPRHLRALVVAGGELSPALIRVNGSPLPSNAPAVDLRQGSNPVL
ncbi:MAG: hypothetical protein MUC42_16560, partial [Bryobacter sp.]|nr:hypothetical protein [Bryobacter sp.]